MSRYFGMKTKNLNEINMLNAGNKCRAFGNKCRAISGMDAPNHLQTSCQKVTPNKKGRWYIQQLTNGQESVWPMQYLYQIFT